MRRRPRRWGALDLRPMVCAAVLGLAFLACVSAFRVHSHSMHPSLAPGDVVLTERLSLLFEPPPIGALVVAGLEGLPPILKRVVAGPGDAVALRRARLTRNGHRVWETHSRYRHGGVKDLPPTAVPDDAVLVMGDDRDTSVDSRHFGPVPVERLRGRVRLRIWPLSRAGALP